MATTKIIEFPKSPSSLTRTANRKPISHGKGGDAQARGQHPVKVRLKEKGWTMDQLAEKVGVSPATIRNQLAGRHRMADGKFHRMLKQLGMNENEYWKCGPHFDRAKASAKQSKETTRTS